MTPADLERLAELMHTRAGMDPAEPVVPVHLAGKLFGWENVVEVAGLSKVAMVRGTRLLLRAGESDARHDWHTARALAQWALEGSATEAAVDSLAAAIRTPKVAFLPLARHRGPRLDELAEAFQISQSAAAMRYAEVVGGAVILFAPDRPVRVRGTRPKSARPRTLRLSDAPDRFVRLFVA